jgi:hypothetical protein
MVNGLFRASASYLMLDVDTVHSAITLFDQVQAVVPYYKLGIADWWDKLPTGFYLEDFIVWHGKTVLRIATSRYVRNSFGDLRIARFSFGDYPVPAYGLRLN